MTRGEWPTSPAGQPARFRGCSSTWATRSRRVTYWRWSDAAPVGQAKADYQQWLAQLDVRTKTAHQIEPAVVPAPTVMAADAAVREARIKLASARQSLINLGLPVPADDFKGLSDEEVADRMHFLGIPEDECRGLDPRTSSNNLLPIRSSITGTVTSRDVVAGEVVDPDQDALRGSGQLVVWLTVGVRSEDAARIRVGQTKVRFEPDGYGGEVEGPVAWLSTEADHKTRTVRVRVNLAERGREVCAPTRLGTGG